MSTKSCSALLLPGASEPSDGPSCCEASTGGTCVYTVVTQAIPSTEKGCLALSSLGAV
jgi:hypothetical protein